MMSKTKISIRFFDDREVRAVWDEQNAKWWFSVLDIIALLTDQDDYTKNRNYWKYLKAKLKKENSELVSATTQLKLLASDGKRYFTDMLDYSGIIDWSKIGKREYMDAMMLSPTKSNTLKTLLYNALTDKINDREMFMKGIDYSYYYEEKE